MEETKEEIIEYKIYQIVCNETCEVYFGKTTETLKERLRKHCYDNCTSKKIIDRDNYYIEKIDSTFDEEESKILERFYIETFECINKNIPGRKREEWIEAHKDELIEKQKKYYEAHKDEFSEKKKIYYEAHKDEFKKRHKKYYEKNKDEILEKCKEYRETHKNEISEKRKKDFKCDCGSIYRKYDKAQHEKSQKHIKYINSLK
jgi:hypothetical protein